MNELTNFKNTLRELQYFLSMPIENNRDKAGIIQAFEFTYEQAWKSIQKYAAGKGSDIGNPKSALSFALQNHWIEVKDEPKWLQLLKDRNLTAHTYQEEVAAEVLKRIREDYVNLFAALLHALETDRGKL